jgi:branched-chain amino acid transport system permease protein
MEASTALVINAIIAGLLLGGFYAAVSLGISISFGMLDVVNIAHPAFIILGSYVAYIVNDRFGFDPIVVSVVLSPLFFALGMALYRIYYVCFEKRGQESLRGLAFFFGILFITEVALVLIFGVDYRMVSSVYGDVTWRAGDIDFPMRLVVPFLVSVAMVAAVQLFLTHTFFGRAVLAVAQDQLALRLMGVNPVRIKELAFALSIATASTSAWCSPCACWGEWARSGERSSAPWCWAPPNPSPRLFSGRRGRPPCPSACCWRRSRSGPPACLEDERKMSR